MDESEAKRNLKEEQLEMMEKSFQMASKYMPTATGVTATPNAEPAETTAKTTGSKTAIVPVSQVRERTVSALQPEMSGAEFMETYGQPRNMGFLTATDKGQNETKNTLLACIHDDQTIMDGQSVRLRLLEAMQAGKMLIPLGKVNALNLLFCKVSSSGSFFAPFCSFLVPFCVTGAPQLCCRSYPVV
jgi:conjugative transposon TraM protein